MPNLTVNIGGENLDIAMGGVPLFPFGVANTWSAINTFQAKVAITITSGNATPCLVLTPDLAPAGSASVYRSSINGTGSTIAFATTNQTGNFFDYDLNKKTITNPSATATITNAATVRVSGAPVASTNTTITNGYAVLVAADAVGLGGKVSLYNNIATAGSGVPFIVATAQTGSVASTQTNIINYTPPASRGTYRMYITISSTSGTNTGNWTPAIGYKSDGGQTTFAPNFEQSGTLTYILAPTGASKDFFAHFTFGIDNSATAITLTLTVAGTVASFITATLEQLQ
jgi:hypothetical protein